MPRKNKKARETWQPVENHQYAVDMHGLRSSNAATVHADKRDRRARTRQESERRDIRDYE